MLKIYRQKAIPQKDFNKKQIKICKEELESQLGMTPDSIKVIRVPQIQIEGLLLLLCPYSSLSTSYMVQSSFKGPHRVPKNPSFSHSHPSPHQMCQADVVKQELLYNTVAKCPYLKLDLYSWFVSSLYLLTMSIHVWSEKHQKNLSDDVLNKTYLQ